MNAVANARLICFYFIIVKNGRYKLELYLAVATYVDIFCEAKTEILNYILWKMLQNP